MFKYLLTVAFFLNILNANYLIEYSKQKSVSKQDLINQYNNFNEIHKNTLTWYMNEIEKKWPKKEVTNKHYFVRYDKNFTKKIIVDFRNAFIILSIISDNEKQAAIELAKSFEDLMKLDVESSFKHDILFNKIILKSDLYFTPIDNKTKIIGDVFEPTYQKKIYENILKNPLDFTEFRNSKIYTFKITMPSGYKKKKEKFIKNLLDEFDTNIPKDLLYAQIKYQSGYNFFSRNGFRLGLLGLNQIEVGIEHYYNLKGHYAFLDIGYFYNFNNNLKLGALYFESILKQLKNISNNKTKFYLASLIYQYDNDEVLRVFNCKNSIELVDKVNKLDDIRIYKFLMKKLKRKEMRNYLFRISKEAKNYI